MYLGIDQHRKQLTVCVRNQKGNVVLRRQVSTRWDRVRAFLAEIAEKAGKAGFVVILEVCGFNDWLLTLLREYGCREVILVQPQQRSKKKTDRRDANALSEILWVNRQRLLAGQLLGADTGLPQILWQMVKNNEAYVVGGPPRRKLRAQAV